MDFFFATIDNIDFHILLLSTNIFLTELTTAHW